MTIQTTHLESETQNPATRHFVILPTHHEDVLRLKDKLRTFQDPGWKVRDFGAFDCGFLIIEIYNLEGYHTFKRDMCSLTEQGLKYVYPEHIICWLWDLKQIQSSQKGTKCNRIELNKRQTRPSSQKMRLSPY